MSRKRFWSYWINILGGVRNSAIALQSFPLGHITADKRAIKDMPKFLVTSKTSFIRKTLYAIVSQRIIKINVICNQTKAYVCSSKPFADGW
jgi:hypothetical protein